MLIFIEWKLTYYNLGEQLRTVSRDSPHITDSFQTHIAWFPYDRYDRWKKSSAIAAIIWKPLSSDRSDRSDNDRWDRLQFYLSDRGDSSDHMETTIQLSQRQQKYQDASRTLTLFKMAANTNIEKARDLAPFMEEVQKTTVFTTNFQRNIERSTRKSTAGKQSGRNSIKVLNMSSLSFPSSSMLKNTHNYKKTRLM